MYIAFDANSACTIQVLTRLQGTTCPVIASLFLQKHVADLLSMDVRKERRLLLHVCLSHDL